MKRAIALVLTLILALSLFTACGDAKADTTDSPATETPAAPENEPATQPDDIPVPDGESVELYVFAAASMNKALPEIADAYKVNNPNVEFVFNFESSGTLKTQIIEGAYCDIFISAGQKQVNEIEAGNDANADGHDLILSDSRFNLLENQIVLVVPDGNPAGIESYDDLGTDKLNLLAIGNSDVPVGQYAAEILGWMGIYDQLNDAGKITFGTNTTEVTTQVAERAVDCGIVYKTDVASAADPSALEIIEAAPEGSVSRAIYPAAIVKGSENADAAQAFLDFLKGPEASAILESYGFDTSVE